MHVFKFIFLTIVLFQEKTDFWGWFVAFQHPKDVWKENPYFLCGEILYCFLAILTLIHGKRQN
jgi:hypothetical protein